MALLDGFDLALEGGDDGLEGGRKFAGAGGFCTVLLGDLMAISSCRRLTRVRSRALLRGRSAPQRQDAPAFAAIGSQHCGIDGVALAVGAEGSDEALELVGIGAMAGNAGPEALLKQQLLVASGRLAYDEVGPCSP